MKCSDTDAQIMDGLLHFHFPNIENYRNGNEIALLTFKKIKTPDILDFESYLKTLKNNECSKHITHIKDVLCFNRFDNLMRKMFDEELKRKEYEMEEVEGKEKTHYVQMKEKELVYKISDFNRKNKMDIYKFSADVFFKSFEIGSNPQTPLENARSIKEIAEFYLEAFREM